MFSLPNFKNKTELAMFYHFVSKYDIKTSFVKFSRLDLELAFKIPFNKVSDVVLAVKSNDAIFYVSEGSVSSISAFCKASISSSFVTIYFNSDAHRFLAEIKDSICYDCSMLCKFDSIYTTICYKFFKERAGSAVTRTKEEIRQLLGFSEKVKWCYIERILNNSYANINKHSDINVNISPVKARGRYPCAYTAVIILKKSKQSDLRSEMFA